MTALSARRHPLAIVLVGALLAALAVVSAPGRAAAQTPYSPDRYGTAAAIAAEAFPDGADVALLASGERFPDALAGASLAAAYDAPILLSARDHLPAATAQALIDLGVGDVIVLGGPAAISHEVSNTLELDYQVSRVAGEERFATAAAIAGVAFPEAVTTALLASGERYPDALAGATLAAAAQAPILLTTRTTVPTPTILALHELGVTDVIVLGGSQAISEHHVPPPAGGAPLRFRRVAGEDRYGTAAAIAAEAFPETVTTAVLASGESFADALAGGPLAARLGAPLLLTGRNAVPAATAAALADLGVEQVLLLGGSAAISVDVARALEADFEVRRIAGGLPEAVVQVFFSNPSLGDPCGEVFGVERLVADVDPPAGALDELLRGPTPAEQAQGYRSWFSAETAGMLRSVRIEEGVAHADFADFSEIIPNASTSCGSAALLAELDRTLGQFAGVEDTRYSFDGDVEAFYSWLQLAVPQP